MQKYSDVVLDALGNAISGATVTVKDYPSLNASTVYATDNSGGSNVNPLTTDSSGRFSFYAPSGHYSLVITKTGYATVEIDDITLEDYVTGTWTPTLTFATPGDLAVTYSVRDGVYTKIGRLVHIGFNVVTSAFTFTTASGNVSITGLPYTSDSTSNRLFYGHCVWQGITKANYTDVAPYIVNGTSALSFAISGSGQAAADVAATDMPTGGTVRLRGSIIYGT